MNREHGEHETRLELQQEVYLILSSLHHVSGVNSFTHFLLNNNRKARAAFVVLMNLKPSFSQLRTQLLHFLGKLPTNLLEYWRIDLPVSK